MSNPFAPPESQSSAQPDPAELAATGPWRHEGRLVARRGSLWPRRCVKCNTDRVMESPLRVDVEWTPGWVFFLVVLGLLPYVIARVSVRRRGWIRLFLCRTHLAQRVAWRIGTPIGATAAFVAGMALASVTNQQAWLILPIVALISVFVLPFGTVWAHAINGRRLELGGAGPAFLGLLPPLVEGTLDDDDPADLGNVDP